MTLLAAYDRARAAIAEARTVKATLEIRDLIAHLKLHARQVQDRELMAEAAGLQLEAELDLGRKLIAAEQAGELRARGERGKAKGAPVDDQPRPATLEEIGVDRKLAVASRKLAAMSEVDFAATVTATRDRIKSGKAITIDVAGSRAIMASRVEADDSLDYFPTPPWATRALIDLVLVEALSIEVKDAIAWEPACGEGHIAEVLTEYFADVIASDIHDYGYGDGGDFLSEVAPDQLAGEADWIITNPPFGDKSEAFLLRALNLANVGVAMFVRLQWLETEGRYERVFSQFPPTLIAFFAERVNLCKGRWDPDGTTATAYIWLVWIKGAKPRAPFWIPPGCRESFARPDDVERFTQHPVVKQSMVPA